MLIAVVYYAWIGFLAISGVWYLFKHRDWIVYYRQIKLRLYIYIIPTIGLVIFVYTNLLALNPELFGASWIKALAGLLGKDASGANISTAGINIPVIGILLCLLIMVQLPSWANAEEKLFREGTKNWIDGLRRSLLFGLVHMIVGVPFGAALALALAGLLFTYMYFKGGVELSTQTHFQYNLALLTILLLFAISITLQ